MSDVVDELRRGYDADGLVCDLMKRAADEIERLRSLCGCADVGPSYGELDEAYKAAFIAHRSRK